ncbi:hypothetical protein Lal_00018082 [Lupinus albus]|uniref:Putative leucine-rich repeat domain, L domain-containing protein n=1 Tax=Lupinus albus TaxID=3870 RepID=A0A6A5M0L0_LUPAL|nr:putative leucine-rich repeat domain, L domain-containing protein [Lupinus albus]KAF1866697.1 hypothetical protein Lal_00018082 [Lupinus albus]
MALFSLFLFIFTLFSIITLSHQQPPLDPTEQQSLYKVLHSINPTIPWPTLFPDDLCLSSPHGILCDYPLSNNNYSHIVELNFGYVSDETPNPPCSLNSTLNPLLFTSFPHLQKLFFFKCFNQTQKQISFPTNITFSFSSNIQELVFIDNPSLVIPLSSIIQNFTNLRRLVLIGNGFYGEISKKVDNLVSLEELTLSGNNLSGVVPTSLDKLGKLEIIDLSHNNLEGCVPESFGNVTFLVKLDLSYNRFGCRIPESLKDLQSLELLDLSFNLFGNFGVPLFLGEIPSLKEVYLSGNLLGGMIPEIWENLERVIGIGFSNMGLIGKIPNSMGFYLKNLTYLGLDNNNLVGPVPEEFGLLKFADEINLENNNLSGRVPSSIKVVGEKLKLEGNDGLCVEEKSRCSDYNNGCSFSQLKQCNYKPDMDLLNAVLFSSGGVSLLPFHTLILLFVSMGLLFVFT